MAINGVSTVNNLLLIIMAVKNWQFHANLFISGLINIFNYEKMTIMGTRKNGLER